MVYGELIGYTVLTGLFVTPLAILWFISFCLARRKHDPARVGVAWIKTAFPFWTLGAFLTTVGGGLSIWSTSDYAYEYLDSDSIYYLNEAISHIGTTGYFFANLADICLFITFVELASGFLLCLKGDGKPAPSRRISRFAILAWSFVLFAVSISYFGLAHAAASRYRRAYTDGLGRSDRSRELAEYSRESLALSRLTASFEILKWITSIPMLGAASYVVHKTRNHEILRHPAVLFLVATILDFIRLIITMAISITRNLTTSRYTYSTPTAVYNIVEPFFDYVFMFVILVLLFSLAVRKRNGLWSQPQQGWNYPTVMYVPAQMAPMPAPGQQPMVAPMQQQQQQQQQQQPPTQGLPAYLQVAQQQQAQQMAPQQGYYYYPQQVQQPQPVYQQQGVPPEAAEQKPTA